MTAGFLCKTKIYKFSNQKEVNPELKAGLDRSHFTSDLASLVPDLLYLLGQGMVGRPNGVGSGDGIV